MVSGQDVLDELRIGGISYGAWGESPEMVRFWDTRRTEILGSDSRYTRWHYRHLSCRVGHGWSLRLEIYADSAVRCSLLLALKFVR